MPSRSKNALLEPTVLFLAMLVKKSCFFFFLKKAANLERILTLKLRVGRSPAWKRKKRDSGCPTEGKETESEDDIMLSNVSSSSGTVEHSSKEQDN